MNMTLEEVVSWTWAVCNSSHLGPTRLIFRCLGYTMNCIRYLSSSNPVSVLSASHKLYVPPGAPQDFTSLVDRATAAMLELPNNATATMLCDMAMPGSFLPK